MHGVIGGYRILVRELEYDVGSSLAEPKQTLDKAIVSASRATSLESMSVEDRAAIVALIVDVAQRMQK